MFVSTILRDIANKSFYPICQTKVCVVLANVSSQGSHTLYIVRADIMRVAKEVVLLCTLYVQTFIM